MRRPRVRRRQSQRVRPIRKAGRHDLRRVRNRDVHDDSKDTTLPIAKAIVDTYVKDDAKPPCYVDLLNMTLGSSDLAEARRRIALLVSAFPKTARASRKTSISSELHRFQASDPGKTAVGAV